MTITSALFLSLSFTSLVSAALVFWVKMRKTTKTEKNFNLTALWSCLSLASLYVVHILDSSVTSNLFRLLGQDLPPPSLDTHILATVVVMFYIWIIYRWSTQWSGLRTRHAYTAARDGINILFVVDGIQETIRLLRQLPAHEVYISPRSDQAKLTLPDPVPSEEFHRQVRDLILGRWSEYVVHEGSWVDAAQCWYGSDSSLDSPLLIFCALNPSSLDPMRVHTQITHHSLKKTVQVIAVFEQDVTEHETATLFGLSRSNVTIYSFDKLIDAVLPLARYKAHISQEFTEKPLPNSDLSISEVIVDTVVRRLDPQAAGGFVTSTTLELLSDYIYNWLDTSTDQHLALLGDYGQGKSTAALELTYRLLHDDRIRKNHGKRIPILIRLTGMSPRTTTPEDLLGAWGTSMGFSGRALLALHRAGRTVLIFDAFDEMANVSDRAHRLDHFGALWRFASEGSKLLFTGRPNFFLDNEELKLVLGISELSPSGPYCTAIRIEPFSIEQVKRSLRWLPTDRAQQLLEIMLVQPRLLEIASRPSLLFQLSQLWKDGQLDLKNQSVQSGTIIKQFLSYSIERQIRKQYQDVSASMGDRTFIRLRESELTYFTAGCAVASLSGDRNSNLSESDFRRIIEDMWGKVGDEDQFERKPTEESSLTMPLRERLADEDDPVAVCEQIVRTHGVIELDPTRRSVYRFSHKSLAEASSANVIASGAVGEGGEWAEAWKATRPLGLLRQFTIFQFCHDFARYYAVGTEKKTEHEVYSNITLTSDSLLRRILYYYRRLFLVAQIPDFARRVAMAKAMEGGRRKERGGIWNMWRSVFAKFISVRWVMQLAPMCMGIGMMAGVFVATEIGDAGEANRGWQTVLVAASVPISMVGYFGLLSAVSRHTRLLILFCNMFAHPEIGPVQERRREDGLRGVLREVLSNPRAFMIYRR